MKDSPVFLFAGSLCVSAMLLFGIQPLVARQLLPLLGGTPAVWTTCLLFFQATLLAGYLYAHLVSRMRARPQALTHLLVLAGATVWVVLGRDVPDVPRSTAQPVPWILGELAVVVGLPAVALSASSPLLQRWYSLLGVARSSDPYFLFAGSNAGSLLGLLAYPLLIEPLVGLQAQRAGWEMACVLLLLLVSLCGRLLWIRGGVAMEPAEDPGQPLERYLRVRWLLLAFIPSSLTLGVTTFIATDLVSMPLLWVVPLSLYLATFIVTFGPWKPISHQTVVQMFPLTLLPVAILLVCDIRGTLFGLIVPHLVLLTVVGLLCHGELEDGRPHTSRLSEFYLWIAVGGVLGGVFNAVAAPLIFTSVWEYPLVVVLSAFVPALSRRQGGARAGLNVGDLAVPVATGVAVLLGVKLIRQIVDSALTLPLALIVPAVLAFGALARPVRFGLTVGALVVIAFGIRIADSGPSLHQSRSFFGVHRVVQDDAAGLVNLFHGTTIHGRRSLDPQKGGRPISYYHPGSPVAQLFRVHAEKLRHGRIAVVGLGSGALVQHGSEGQQWDFFEIDKAVVEIASNPALFSFLSRARPRVDIVLGDGRTSLAARDSVRYDLLVLDAFSSDAIPVHLLSREAMELYLRRLRPDGMVLLHISNRYMDLQPVLARLAESLELDTYVKSSQVTAAEQEQGYDASIWAVMARDGSALDPIRRAGWQPLDRNGRHIRLWTDDYSNILAVLNWR